MTVVGEGLSAEGSDCSSVKTVECVTAIESRCLTPDLLRDFRPTVRLLVIGCKMRASFWPLLLAGRVLVLGEERDMGGEEGRAEPLPPRAMGVGM